MVGVETLDRRLLFAVDTFSPVTLDPAVNVTRSPAAEGETTIAVDPSNPSHLFSASETDSGGLFGAYSTDGGATWAGRSIADGTDGLGTGNKNPQAMFDAFGNLYLSYLETATQRAVRVAVSEDGGQTFAPVYEVRDSGLDQPSIAVGGDMLSGLVSVWVTYRNGTGGISAAGAPVFGPGATQIGTFSAAQSVPGGTGNFGDIAVGPAGEVVVTWQTNTAGEGPASILVSTDFDGLGPAGFLDPVTVTATNVGGFDFLPAQPKRAIDAEANLAYDASAGPAAGRLYLVYTDESPDEGNNFDVFVRASYDHGFTWGEPVRVNDDATQNSQFLPEIGVDPVSGQVVVGWYDARDDAGVVGAGSLDPIPNNDVRYWGAVSTDGGTSFLNFPVAADVSHADTAGNPNDFGDYTAVAAYGGRVHFAWADNSAALPDNPARPQLDLAVASGTVSPLAGPRVRSSTPEGTLFGAVGRVDFTFDRPMDPGTFSVVPDVFLFNAPGGRVDAKTLTAQWLADNRTLRLSFPQQVAPGNYTLILGADIRSVAGDPLDQDADGVAGEASGDRYIHRFTVTPPRIIAHRPQSPKVGTHNAFDFDFNQPMDPTTFTVADDVVSFTGPTGADLRTALTSVAWSNGNRTLRVNFDRQGADGLYSITVGPRVFAAGGGLAMDQDGDFVVGESDADAYAATLTIDRSTGPDAFGYQAWTHAFQFLDLSPTGTGVLTAVDGADDGAATIPLGTNAFNFYGRVYSGTNVMFVSSNGVVTFAAPDTAFQNDDLTAALRGAAIAPLWDDWKTDAGTDSRVLYRFDDLNGDARSDRLVIEWNQVPNAAGSGSNPATFQAVLQLNSGATPGEIVFNYPDLDVGAASVLNGAGATVGIKDDGAQGDRRLVVSMNLGTGPYVAGGKAVRIATTPQPAQAPTLTSLTDNPDAVRTGATVSLTANNPIDVDGAIASVSFYRESNGTGGLQTGAGGDTLLGTDVSGVGGYTAAATTTGLADGTYVYYAVATDNQGLASNVAVATGRVDNIAPTVDVGDVSPDPRTAQLSTITIRFSEAVTGLNMSDLVLTRNGGANLLTSGQTVTSSDSGVTWTLGGLWSITAMAANYTLTLNAANSGIADIAGNPLAAGASDAWRKNAGVVERWAFYNQSNFDRNLQAADASDDIAVAADKKPLLPGQTASFLNVTSYSRGINGVMIDMFGLIGTPTAADFDLRVGNGTDPATWQPAPAPVSVTRRNGAGAGDSDRVVLVFPSGSIVNEWLQVTMKATAVTGLAAPDVFYYGNLVGETGNAAPGATTMGVNAADVAAVRDQGIIPSVLVTNRYDFNRDGKVNSTDLLLARGNQASATLAVFSPKVAGSASVTGAATPARSPATVRSQLLFGGVPIV